MLGGAREPEAAMLEDDALILSLLRRRPEIRDPLSAAALRDLVCR